MKARKFSIFSRFLLPVLLLALTVHACFAAEPNAIGAQPLKSYAKLLKDFTPELKAVTLASTQAEPTTVTREGQGRLECYADGHRVLHLKGTPYEMGFQHGTLLRADVRRMTDTILVTVGLVETLRSGENFRTTLSKIYARCQPHIPAEYIEEGRGMAEGAGLTHETIDLHRQAPRPRTDGAGRVDHPEIYRLRPGSGA